MRHSAIAGAIGAAMLARGVWAQTLTTWIGPASGNWNSAANWSGTVVPRNGTPPGSTYHAVIDGGAGQNSVVNLDFFNSLTNLTVSTGDEVNVGTFILGFGSPVVSRTITNAGTIRTAAGGGILINTSTFNIGGGGTIILNNGNIIDNNNGERLTNIDNLITGSGTIAGAMAFTNQSTIRASGGILTMGVGAGFTPVEWVNTGTLNATGGRLRIHAPSTFGTLNNAGGTIAASANPGSTVTLGDDLIVIGGTLATAGSNKFQIEGVAPFFPLHAAHIGSLTLNGEFQIDPGTTLKLVGPIVNNGTITIHGNGGGAYLSVSGNGVTLSGGGFVRLNSLNGGTATFGNLAVTNFDNTFVGSGLMGNGYSLINNAGTITASGGTMTVTGSGNLFPEPGGINFISSGTMSAEAGATMVLAPVGTHAFDCSTGTFLIDGTLRVNATTAAGRISGAGTVILAASTSMTATDLRVGRLSVPSGATLTINTGGGTIGTSVLKSLSITSGRLNVNDHDLVIDHDGTSPIASLQSLIASAYAGGAWTGVGLTSASALAAGNTALGYAEATDLYTTFPVNFSGQSVDETSVLVQYTLCGIL